MLGTILMLQFILNLSRFRDMVLREEDFDKYIHNY